MILTTFKNLGFSIQFGDKLSVTDSFRLSEISSKLMIDTLNSLGDSTARDFIVLSCAWRFTPIGWLHDKAEIKYVLRDGTKGEGIARNVEQAKIEKWRPLLED